MEYSTVQEGIFVSRPNRFIANVKINDTIETVHVKNTGRCKELLIPGVKVILHDNKDFYNKGLRKTRYDLIAVYKDTPTGKILINMDSQAPNKVVKEWLLSQGLNKVIPEYTYGKSRVDFYIEHHRPILMEVKGCTLEKDGIGYFPDAPTERGVKHLRELKGACEEGIECYIAFVIQIPGVKEVRPNIETHAEFGKALKEAMEKGVKVLYLKTEVWEKGLKIIEGPLFSN